MDERGLAASTIDRRLSTICGYYRFAHIDGRIRSNPAQYVRRPHVHPAAQRGMDRGELAAFCHRRVEPFGVMADCTTLWPRLIWRPAAACHVEVVSATGRTRQHSMLSCDVPSGPTDEFWRRDPSILRNVENGPPITDLSTEHLVPVIDANRKEDEPR